MRYVKKKVYGASKMERRPLCGEYATLKNNEGIPVCKDHKTYSIELKCACGEILEAHEGKWGCFFVCRNCGSINWNKAMSMNDLGQ